MAEGKDPQQKTPKKLNFTTERSMSAPQSQVSVASVGSTGSTKTITRQTWTRAQTHDGFSDEVMECAAGSKERKVLRLLDRDAAEFQSTGDFKLKRDNMPMVVWLTDPFHSLLTMRTSFLLLICLTAYLLLWLAFACAWLAVSEADCGVTLTTYRQAFYLALETLVTIGYGVDDQYFNDCIEAAPVLAIGSYVSVLLDAFLLGLLVLRFGLSRRRTRTIVFSDMALLKVIDEQVCLTCRVFGMHQRPILQASLQVYALQHRYVGSTLKVDVTPLQIEVPDMDSTNGPVFVGLPLTITHCIDASSPLAPPGLDRDPTAEEMKTHFNEHPFLEVIVCLSGTIEHTGNTAEKRHSYTLNDIFWNRQFVKCVSVDEQGMHNVNFQAFHLTKPALDAA